MAYTSEQWAFVFGVLGNIISFCVFLSPLPTFYMIYKKKSTEGFQSVPYVVALFSAMLWIYYAFLKPNSTLLITINTFGVFIEVLYISFYLYYGTKQARLDTSKMLVGIIVVGFGLVLALTHYFSHGPTRTAIVGWICLVFSLCVFVAPLAIVRKVIKTKSVEYMPLSLSAFLTMSAVVWFFYGLLRKDVNIYLPNVLGFSFGVLQMILYRVYNKQEKSIKAGKQQFPGVLKDQIVIVDDDMLMDNNKTNIKKPAAETKIDVDNKNQQTAGGESETISVVLRRVDEPITIEPPPHCIQMGPQPPIIAVRG